MGGKRCPVLMPVRAPLPEERALVRNATWEEVESALQAEGIIDSKDKVARTKKVFLDLADAKGIVYAHKKMGPEEMPFEWLVGQRVLMDANFHVLYKQLENLIVRSDVKKGKDYKNFPKLTRDLRNGWTADDPVKRLARAQSALIKRKSQAASKSVSASGAKKRPRDHV